jgi:hypothetical protein
MATAIGGISGLGRRDITRTETLQLELRGINTLGGQKVLRLRVGTKALTPWNIGCPDATVVIRDASNHQVLAHQAVAVWGALNCAEDIEVSLPAGTDLSQTFRFEIYPGRHAVDEINGGLVENGIIRELRLGPAIEEVEQASDESWGEWIGGEVGDITAEVVRPLALPIGIAVGGVLLVTNFDKLLELGKKLT